MKNADKNNHTVQTDARFESKNKSHLFLLSYQNGKGLQLTNLLKRNLKRILPSTVKANVGFASKKLSTCFQIKYQTKFEHKLDIVYLKTCLEEYFSDHYIGESTRQISKRAIATTIGIQNRTFLNMALKSATNTFTLTALT